MGKGVLVWTGVEGGQAVTLEMQVDGKPLAAITYDAAALEDNIHMLGKARAWMSDPVTPDLEVGMRLEAIADPKWKAEAHHPLGGSMLALRHPGLGWVSFLLPPAEARALGQSLVAQADALEAKADPEAS